MIIFTFPQMLSGWSVTGFIIFSAAPADIPVSIIVPDDNIEQSVFIILIFILTGLSLFFKVWYGKTVDA